MPSRSVRRRRCWLLFLALRCGIHVGAPPLASAEPSPDVEPLLPDRLDRSLDESERPEGSGLWVAAMGQARVFDRSSGAAAEAASGRAATAIGVGILLGGSLDALAGPEVAAVEPAPPPGPLEPSVRVDAALARGSVAAARARERAARDEDRLEGLASRSRTSASLPELRLRVMRVVDEDAAVAPTEYDPERTTQSGGTSTWLEARATWRLDRWVFAREEIAIERLRQARARATHTIEREVLEALGRWQRARWRSLDPEAPAEERIGAELDASLTESTLDVMTDGWFSKELQRRTRRGGSASTPRPRSGRRRCEAPAASASVS